MKKIILLVILAVFLNANAARKGSHKQNINDKNFTGFIWNAVPMDSTAEALYNANFEAGKDTLTDTLGAAGADTAWIDYGPFPSEVADSNSTGTIGFVVGGTGGAVGCSLFVAMTPDRSKWTNASWLKHISSGLTNNTGTIITDSLTSVSKGIYAIPNLRTYRGFRLIGKAYTYSGGSAIAVKKTYLQRDKQ